MKLSFFVLATPAACAVRRGNTPRQTPATSCAALKAPTIPDATVVSMQTLERRNFTLPGDGGASPPPRLSFCDVNITLTHGAANDSVRVEVWMPLEGWNGRFQGTGGGGFVPGVFGAAMAPQVAAGFAAASTDAGIKVLSTDGGGIAFDDQLMTNFASLSVHEMALVGKAMTQQFYGSTSFFSYWNGCSTGGRQGYMEAQRFPEDFDGILAAAPAINWDKFCPAEVWPFQVQTEAKEFVPACVMTALTEANIQACDGLDGGMDGFISDPTACRFDAKSKVGTTVSCNGEPTTISKTQASIYNRILSGPTDSSGAQLWFGVAPGSSLDLLAGSTPLSLGATWLDTFVGNSTQLGGRISAENTLSAEEYTSLFQSSVNSKFGVMLATNDTDLSGLKAAGNKLLSWHGLADTIIMPQGTFDYRRRVEAQMGGSAAVDEFYRLFTAPGVAHCAGGGPAPDTATALDVLIRWVEDGVAPDTLPANMTTGNTTVSRNLCRFPLVARFDGGGDVNDAEGWTCVESQGLEETALRSLGAATASRSGGVWLYWMIFTSFELLWFFL